MQEAVGLAKEPKGVEEFQNILNEHPLLLSDKYTNTVLETGKTDSGREVVDMEKFLRARATVLEARQAEEDLKKLVESDEDLARAVKADVKESGHFVVNSVRPDLEN